MWTFLREMFLALIGQPSSPAPTQEERETARAQQQHLRQSGPASARDALRQVGAEVGKVSIGQPTPAPRRKK